MATKVCEVHAAGSGGMMTTNQPTRHTGSLPELWRAWTQVVGQFAIRKRTSANLSAKDYEVLYREIVSQCETRATYEQSCGDFFRRLGDVVRPWVSLQAFRHADSEILTELYSQCLTIDRQMQGGRVTWSEFAHRHGKVIVALTTTLGVIGIGVFTDVPTWAAETLSSWGRLVRLWLLRRSAAEVILMTAVVALALGWLLVSRTRRS